MKAELRLLKLRKEKHDAIAALSTKYDKRIATLLKSLDGKCKHPIEVQQPLMWVWDSGYGHQKQREGITCGACGKQKLWTGSTLWYYPGECGND